MKSLPKVIAMCGLAAIADPVRVLKSGNENSSVQLN